MERRLVCRCFLLCGGRWWGKTAAPNQPVVCPGGATAAVPGGLACAQELNASMAFTPLPEYESFLAFDSPPYSDPACRIARARAIPRLTAVDPAELTARHLSGEGAPAIIRDGQRGWTASEKWTFDFFKLQYPEEPVLANNRAPARRSDDPRQQTVSMSLAEYVDYVHTLRTLPPNHPLVVSAPFYLNGWNCFSKHPELLEFCPKPYFAEDDTVPILQALESRMSSKTHQQEDGQPNWVRDTDILLSKLFMGPRGTITRLHCDAHCAHAWLSQVCGRKLFVLYSPNDSPFLYEMSSEATKQSAVDPLSPQPNSQPLSEKATPHVAVLQPGESIVVPEGWWHYAVALDDSITIISSTLLKHRKSSA